jgi:hypothetical protein
MVMSHGLQASNSDCSPTVWRRKRSARPVPLPNRRPRLQRRQQVDAAGRAASRPGRHRVPDCDHRVRSDLVEQRGSREGRSTAVPSPVGERSRQRVHALLGQPGGTPSRPSGGRLTGPAVSLGGDIGFADPDRRSPGQTVASGPWPDRGDKSPGRGTNASNQRRSWPQKISLHTKAELLVYVQEGGWHGHYEGPRPDRGWRRRVGGLDGPRTLGGTGGTATLRRCPPCLRMRQRRQAAVILRPVVLGDARGRALRRRGHRTRRHGRHRPVRPSSRMAYHRACPRAACPGSAQRGRRRCHARPRDYPVRPRDGTAAPGRGACDPRLPASRTLSRGGRRPR